MSSFPSLSSFSLPPLGRRAVLQGVVSCIALGSGVLSSRAEAPGAVLDAAAIRKIAGDVTPDDWGIAQRKDETVRITAMLQWASRNRRRVLWPDGGEYWLSRYEDVGTDTHVHWVCAGSCTLKSLVETPDPEGDVFVKLGGKTVQDTDIVKPVGVGLREITVSSTKNVQPGHLALIMTSKMIDTDSRGQARDGIALRVSEVLSDTTVRLSEGLPFPIAIGELSGKVTGRPSATEIEARGLATDAAGARYRIRFTSGAAKGKTANVIDYDPERAVLTSHAKNSAFPKAVAAGDSFVLERTASVLFSAPAQVTIEGMSFGRAPHQVTSPDKTTHGFRGLVLQRAAGAQLRRVAVANFSDTGLREEWCYRSDMRGLRISGANRSFNGYDGTGYGMSVFQSSYGLYQDISGTTCRRLVDFNGTQGVSWYNTLRHVRATGGGLSFGGERYWPDGDLLVEVAGSHGAAAGTVYEDIAGHDVMGILNIRGLNETASELFGTGRMQRMILVQYGGSGLSAKNVRYDDGITEVGRKAKARNYTVDKEWLNRRLQTIIQFRTDNYGRTRLSTLIGVQANGLQECVFMGSGGKGAVDNLVYGDLVIATDNEGGNYPEFHLFGGQAVRGNNVVALNKPVIFDSSEFPKDKIAL